MPFGIRFRPKSSLLLFTSGVILYKLTSELVIEELGITSSTPETESQEGIVAEIYEIVKNELLKKVYTEWNKGGNTNE